MEEQAFRQAVEDHRDVVFRIALTYLRDRVENVGVRVTP